MFQAYKQCQYKRCPDFEIAKLFILNDEKTVSHLYNSSAIFLTKPRLFYILTIVLLSNADLIFALNSIRFFRRLFVIRLFLPVVFWHHQEKPPYAIGIPV